MLSLTIDHPWVDGEKTVDDIPHERGLLGHGELQRLSGRLDDDQVNRAFLASVERLSAEWVLVWGMSSRKARRRVTWRARRGWFGHGTMARPVVSWRA